MRLKQQLIREFPLFSHCSEESIAALCEYFNPVQFRKNQILVKEGEAVDAVYLIAKGQAEISQIDPSPKTAQSIFLGLLGPGDAIGLNSTGFYSENGSRTATIKALSAVKAYKLELAKFSDFLAQQPNFIPELKAATDIHLRRQFIQKLAFFKHLSPDRLHQAAAKCIEINVPRNQVIFKQGDTADCCYFIIEGSVKVSVHTGQKRAKTVAVLGPEQVFGELGLVIKANRNATLTSKSKCRLLRMDKASFNSLVSESASRDFDSINQLIMARIRPQKLEAISIHERLNAEQETIYILKNASLGNYFVLSECSLFLWHLLDGDHSIQELTQLFSQEYGPVQQEEVANLVLDLMQAGFVEMPELAQDISSPNAPAWLRLLIGIRKALTYEYAVNNVDAWVSAMYQRWGRFFYTKLAQLLLAGIAVFGFLAFILYFPKVSANIHATPYSWLLLLLMGPAELLTIPAHELGHALTTKHFGFQVHRFGIGWFWLGPIAFADTSDMWLASRGQRIAVNLAGIYVNTIIAGLLCFLAWWIPNPTASVFLWMVAFSSYLMAFYNLDTMFELDGYYVLMDAVNKPNLRRAATIWLLEEAKSSLFSKKKRHQYRAEITYWLITLLFLLTATILAYLVQSYILNNMVPASVGHLHPQNYRWILALIVIIMSFASLYGMVKEQAKRQYGKNTA